MGALVAAFAFEIAKNAFLWYSQNFANYNLVYGSLGAVIALLFWAYISAIILLFGAEMSVVYSSRATVGGRQEGKAPVANRSGARVGP